MEAYCVKCREKRQMKDPERKTMRNGRPMMQGVCPVCETKLTRILSAADAAKGGE
ncbi:MAG: hypothetical protein JNG53_05130 [Senegalimassilia sp.]|nr:hypothetical protein [Senegalimassilia sp.]